MSMILPKFHNMDKFKELKFNSCRKTIVFLLFRDIVWTKSKLQGFGFQFWIRSWMQLDSSLA